VTPTTRAQAKAQTRERLLDAAETLFLDSGYAATAMEQIAQAAGVTKPAIYRHFASKEDLFLALRHRRAMRADISPADGDVTDYGERLAEFGRTIARSTEKSDLRLLALQLEFRAVSLRREDARERYAQELRTLIAAARSAEDADASPRAGDATAGEAVVLAQLLVDGLREYRAYLPEVVTEKTFAKAFALLASFTAGE
jgi:AcrR family transcriptional regulator